MRLVKKLLCAASVLVLGISCVGCSSGSSDSKVDTYARGTLTDTTYESETLNLKFTLPEGYSMLSEDDLNASIEADGLCDIKYKDDNNEVVDYASMDGAYEMMAMESTVGVPNVMIVMEKTNASGATVEDYKDGVVSGLTGATVSEAETVDFQGEEYLKFVVTTEESGYTFNQTYMIRKVGKRFFSILITEVDSEEFANSDAIMNAFSTLNTEE